MKYDVHVFAVVRLLVLDVEADSHRAAIEKALMTTNLYAAFDGKNTEYAEEISHYLVDEYVDKGHDNSQWYSDREHIAGVEQMKAWPTWSKE